uniref:Alpha-D-phosphohexomutase alpha/beta/alpha domain-containing protein n=1 Tax=Glossina pallidipes TaxID=7398 RepID=A0A1A9Z171_GLOPL
MYLQTIRSGKKPKKSDLIYPDKLIKQYYVQIPNEDKQLKNIKFGTSGYRGTSKEFTFNEMHVLAISQAIVEARKLLVNMKLISSSQVNLVIDPLGGSNYDGILRIDCASKPTLKYLFQFSNQADLGFANDPDGDRHAILSKRDLISPNHYLSIAMHYLLKDF